MKESMKNNITSLVKSVVTLALLLTANWVIEAIGSAGVVRRKEMKRKSKLSPNNLPVYEFSCIEYIRCQDIKDQKIRKEFESWMEGQTQPVPSLEITDACYFWDWQRFLQHRAGKTVRFLQHKAGNPVVWN